jgi:hypothetical protein
MKIKLDDYFRIEQIDTHNTALYYKKEVPPPKHILKPSKDGKYYDQDHWYYGSFNQALLGYLDKAMMSKEECTFSEIFRKYDEIHNMIKTLKTNGK